MPLRSRTFLALHRVLLRTARPPLLGVWNAVYALLARAWGAYLVRGDGRASIYARGSIGAGDSLPGISDVDVAVVVEHRERPTERWQAVRRRFALTDLLFDYPMIFEPEDLRRAAPASALLYPGTAYSGPHCTQDTVRLLERPGLYRATDWRRLSGPDQRPPAVERTSGERRIAAWLELVAWWRWVFPFCADPLAPRAASLCVRLVAEPARIWLWLAHGERADRTQALRRTIELLPDEEQGLRLALDLQRSLRLSPAAPLAEVLPVLLRLSARIENVIAADARAVGETEVALVGVPPEGPLPLCDWRGLVEPAGRQDWFQPTAGYPGSPSDIAGIADLEGRGPLPVLREGDLMVFAGHNHRTRLRALACPLTDPVSFALADERRVAAFPELPGWRVADVARRAVSEHRPMLDGEPAQRGQLARVLGAVRAGLFADGVAAGEPVLAVTLAEAGRRLADHTPAAAGVAEQAVGELAESVAGRARPAASTVDALRTAARRLPAYAGAHQGLVTHE